MYDKDVTRHTPYQMHEVDSRDIDIVTKMIAMYAKLDSHDEDDPILDRRGADDPLESLENRTAMQKAMLTFLDECKKISMETALETRQEFKHRTITQKDLGELYDQNETADAKYQNVTKELDEGRLVRGDRTEDVYETKTVADNRAALDGRALTALHAFADAVRATHVLDAMEIGVESMDPRVRANLEGLPPVQDMSFDQFESQAMTTKHGLGSGTLFGHRLDDPCGIVAGIAKAFAETDMDALADSLNRQSAGMRATRLLFQREAGPEFQSAAGKLKEHQEQAAMPFGPGL